MRGQIHDWTERDPILEVILEENARLRAQVAALSRSVPSEIPLQLDLNLAMLGEADALYWKLPERVRAQVEALSSKRQFDRLVLALGWTPAESRERITRCVTWLRDDVSSPRDGLPVLPVPLPRLALSPPRLRLIAAPAQR